MEIKSIAVESFRSHDKIEIPLAKFTVITGPNGSGKSSILEAASTVLLGENTWTQRDGVKLQNLIKHGAKQAKVTIVGKRAISRLITAKGSKILLDDKDSLTQFELLQNLKVSEQQVRASLIPTAFLNLSIKEQKDALFSLLGVELTLEEVKKFIPAQALPTWAKIAKKWTEDHSMPEEEGGEAPPLPPVDLDKLYDFVYASRRNYKAKESPAGARNEENDKLVKELSEVSKNIAQANFQAEQRKAVEKEISRIPELEKKVIELASVVTGTLDEIQGRLTSAGADVGETEKARREIQFAQENLEAELRQFGKAKAEPGKKVICPIGLECPHDEASLKNRREYLIGKHEAKARELKAALSKESAAQHAYAVILNEKAEAQKAQEEQKRTQSDLEKARELKKGLGKSMAQDLPGLQKEKARIEAALKAAAAGAVPAEKDATVDHLDLIVKALDVNGIKTQLVKTGIVKLEEEANVVFSKFGPYSIRFFMDGEFSPAILHREAEIQIGELSEGERLIASLVIQDVFAQRSRVNLVVLDNADLLDPETYTRFVRTAMSLKSKVLVGLANEAHAAAGFPNHDGNGDDYRVVNLAPKAVKGGVPKKAGGKKSSEDFL